MSHGHTCTAAGTAFLNKTVEQANPAAFQNMKAMLPVVIDVVRYGLSPAQRKFLPADAKAEEMFMTYANSKAGDLRKNKEKTRAINARSAKKRRMEITRKRDATEAELLDNRDDVDVLENGDDEADQGS
jgi:hypothetical protein